MPVCVSNGNDWVIPLVVLMVRGWRNVIYAIIASFFQIVNALLAAVVSQHDGAVSLMHYEVDMLLRGVEHQYTANMIEKLREVNMLICRKLLCTPHVSIDSVSFFYNRSVSFYKAIKHNGRFINVLVHSHCACIFRDSFIFVPLSIITNKKFNDRK